MHTCGIGVAQVVYSGQLGQARNLALQAEPSEVAAVRLRVSAALRTAMAARLLRARTAVGRPRRLKRSQLRRQSGNLPILERNIPLHLHGARLGPGNKCCQRWAITRLLPKFGPHRKILQNNGGVCLCAIRDAKEIL